MAEFAETAIRILENPPYDARCVQRKGLLPLVDFKMESEKERVEGLVIASESSWRFSCVVNFPLAIGPEHRSELMLFCCLANPELELGQVEFTHNGEAMIAKVTQCLVPGQEANDQIIGECIHTAIQLRRRFLEPLQQIARGEMKAANALATRQFLEGGNSLNAVNLDAPGRSDR